MLSDDISIGARKSPLSSCPALPSPGDWRDKGQERQSLSSTHTPKAAGLHALAGLCLGNGNANDSQHLTSNKKATTSALRHHQSCLLVHVVFTSSGTPGEATVCIILPWKEECGVQGCVCDPSSWPLEARLVRNFIPTGFS